MPLDHQLAWEDLLERAPQYETTEQIPPLRRPEYRDKPRGWITATLVYDTDDKSHIRAPIGVWIFDGSTAGVIPLTGEKSDGNDLAATLLSHSRRGLMVVWLHGQASEFGAILARYIPALLLAGFSVEPGGSLTSIRWLRISRGKQSWWWCDFEAVTGVGVDTWHDLLPKGSRKNKTLILTPVSGHAAVGELSRILRHHFSTTIRPTLAGSAIASMARWMPADLWVWKPPALLVSMCRIGNAYRGGYVYAERYRGPAQKWDINRLYTWCIGQPLPARVAYGRASVPLGRSAGVYMCSISRRGRMPAYLPIWSPGSRLWRKTYHIAGEGITVLFTTEIAALSRLGWAIEPWYGYTFTSTFNLREYSRHLERLLVAYGRDSAEARIGRLMANLAYGRLAQNPDHEELMISAERPGAEWAPMIHPTSGEYMNVWQRHTRTYSAYQHIDIAATITAHGRKRLSMGHLAILRSGGRVVYSDTDSIIASGGQLPADLVSDTQVGSFRYLGYDSNGIVLARKQYVFGEEARLSGYHAASREMAETLSNAV